MAIRPFKWEQGGQAYTGITVNSCANFTNIWRQRTEPDQSYWNNRRGQLMVEGGMLWRDPALANSGP